MARVDLAIELGSFDTVIYLKNSGIVLREASLLLLCGQEIQFIGNEAKKRLDVAEKDSRFIFPVREGVIADESAAALMLKHFLSKVRVLGGSVRAVFCVPCGISSKEKSIFQKVAYKAGINQVLFAPGVVCAKIAYSSSFLNNDAALVCDIGAGKTDIAIVNKLAVSSGMTIALGGYMMTEAVRESIEKNNAFLMSAAAAEKVKVEISSLYTNDASNIEVSGIDLNSKTPRREIIYALDVFNAVEKYYSEIARQIERVIASLPAGLADDISTGGIFLYGGGSNIGGIALYLERKLDLVVRLPDDAENVVMLGAGQLLSDPKLLKEVCV